MNASPNGTQSPPRLRPASVAVIGGGLAGLTAAWILSHQRTTVTVFEKSRGLGGRMATRREAGLAFDHGAQYFTIRDERFRRWLDTWMNVDVVQPWHARLGCCESGNYRPHADREIRYVAVPGMSGLARRVAESTPEMTLRFACRVAQVTRAGDRWALTDVGGNALGEFDAVITACPAPQAAELLISAPEMADRARSVRFLPCWAVMVGHPRPLEIPWDGIRFRDSPLAWAARNATKPARPAGETWVLHATPEWSARHLEADPVRVAAELISAFDPPGSINPSSPKYKLAHRWRYARASHPLGEGCLWDAKLRLGACGDWCTGCRVEDAFLSGVTLASRILGLAPGHYDLATLPAGAPVV